jgi:hypothetical protein
VKQLGFAAVAAAGLAAVAIGLAAPAVADRSVALPPGGPNIVYGQNQSIGGANPYTPFGTNPYVPFGVWTP